MRSSSRLILVTLIALTLRGSYITQVVGSGSPLIGTGVVAGSLDGNSVTTPQYNTVGAGVIVVATSTLGTTLGTVTSSPANTWTCLTQYPDTAHASQICYSLSPTTSTTQTFTFTATGERPAVVVFAFSGVTAFDAGKDIGSSTAGASSIQPGSLTPSATNGILVVQMASNGIIAPVAVDSGFSTPALFFDATATSAQIAASFLVETAAVAKNPTLSWSGVVPASAAMAIFKGSASVGAGAFLGASRSSVGQ